MTGFDKNIKLYVSLIFWLFVIGFVIVLIHAVLLETSQKEIFGPIQQERLIQNRPFEAQRGNIYSYDNTTGELLLLASDEIRYDVYLDLGIGRVSALGQKPEKKDWIIKDSLWKKDLDKFCIFLADNYKTKSSSQWKNYLLKQRKQQNRYTLLLNMITKQELDSLKQIKMIRHAVIPVQKYKRVYPYQDMARRTIGIEVKDDKGIISFNGIDGAYGKVLKGSKGMRMERKIGPNLWIPLEDSIDIKPDIGKDIITTLDIPLQELAESALKKCLDSNDAKSGTVILMETKTGYIKALASFTRVGEDEYYEDRNIAVGSSYEPGSTFKTVTAMLLLDKGMCDTSETVPTGMKTFPGATKPIYDVNKKGPDKEVSLARAIEISSNVGISALVYNYYGSNSNTRQQFAKDLQKYFYYNKLNCDIDIHEPMPKIGTGKYTDDLLRMSFGYVTMMTPLQLLTFYNGIANGGKVMKPMFVRSVMKDGKIIENYDPVVINQQMCKPETLKKIQAMLRGVVLHGTGRRLRSASYGIAGKSGTAEVNYTDTNIKSKYRMHRASFAGYFPADNPMYSCIVVISEPQKALTHGGDLAAPVFRELSDRVMGVNARNTNVTASAGQKTDNNTQQHASSTQMKTFTDQTHVKDSVLKAGVVPDVRGWNVAQAVYCLEKLGYKVTFTGYGNVVSQSIAPKTKITENKHITLTLKNK
ncbi:MAG: transpeptidase family protein [Bacteroidales bacterium]|nr:transpeptidase family protein [Bacteroidales bacterium]